MPEKMMYCMWLKRYNLKIFPFCSSGAKLNFLINLSRGHHKEHFSKVILNLDQWFRGLAAPFSEEKKTFVQYW